MLSHLNNELSIIQALIRNAGIISAWSIVSLTATPAKTAEVFSKYEL